MTTSAGAGLAHGEIRDAVAKLCRGFPGEYWRALDRERAYPTDFVDRLTKEGFLSVLIPEEYGGSGLGLRRRDGDARGDPPLGLQRRGVPCANVHDGRDPAARKRGAEGEISAQDRLWRIAAAGVWRHRADQRHGYNAHPHVRAPRRRPLHRQRPENLDQPRRTFGPDGAAMPHHAARPGEEADRRHERCCWSTCARR